MTLTRLWKPTGKRIYRNQAISLNEDKLIESFWEKETWLTAAECIEYGLADEYAEQDADLTKAKEILQKVNANIAQHIELNKSLAAQVRELTHQVEPEPTPAEPTPPEPKQTENKNY